MLSMTRCRSSGPGGVWVSPHLVYFGQLLSEYRKYLEHFECDQGNKEDDCAEHFHEAKLMEDLGQELNDDRPPNAANSAKDDVLDPVYNGPLRTRRMTRIPTTTLHLFL